MKKMLLFTLVVLLTLTIVGCAADKTPQAPQNTPTQQNAPASQNAPAQTNPGTATPDNSNQVISEEQAKEIALSDAGFEQEDVSYLYAEYDYDDGRYKYEVSFRQGAYEYEYEIDATTGNIISYDKDIDD